MIGVPRWAISASLCVLLLATATGCPWSKSSAAASEALLALETAARNGESADDLLSRGNALGRLSKSEFTDDDWAARARLLGQVEEDMLRAAAQQIDISLTEARAGMSLEAHQTAADSAAVNYTDQFAQDLAEVAEEVATGAACDLILDTFAPHEEPEEPGQGVVDIVSDSIEKLVLKRYARADVENAVNWTDYATSVTEDAQQFVSAADGHSEEHVVYMASRPPVSRALLVYLRSCYSPPRMP